MLSFDRERAATLLVSLGAAVVAVTCAAGQRRTSVAPPPPPPAAPPSAIAAMPVPPAAPVAAPPASVMPPPPAAPEPERFVQELSRVRAALSALATQKRTEHVRVAWLGDSHTYADFWPHAVRTRLARRFGNGGPGYVLIGIKPYRHDRLKLELDGKWRREPKSAASSQKQLDGVFGLAGQRAVPLAADASAGVSLLSGAVSSESANWELLFRATAGDALSVRLADQPPVRVTATSGTATPGGSPLRRLKLSSEVNAKLTVSFAAGAPELFGAIIESRAPGVVVDNLGINGARAATPLSWRADAWQAELRQRAPELVVLAYGTNEAASALSAERYATHLTQLIARSRQAAPEADCLIAGPTDMLMADGRSAPRVPELSLVARKAAKDAGCAFFSPYEVMGGDGGFARWMNEVPALAAPDRVHLTAKGYERLGEALYELISAS